MSAGSFRFLTRILRQKSLTNTHALYRKVNLNVRQSSYGFSRCGLCTEVITANDARQPVEAAPLTKELPQRRVKKVKEMRGNLYDYADEAPVLQNLIDLGVEIYNFSEDYDLCSFLMKLDFEKDISPYLMFLHSHGVPAEKFGYYLTKNPYILKCDFDDLQVRINYLESKKFTKEMISHIITQHPKWLSYNVIYIDTRLGDVQTTFDLTGDEMRSLVCKFPGVISIKHHMLRLNMFTIKEEFGIDMNECKSLLLKEPRLLKQDNRDLVKTLHYLIYNMYVQVHLIIEQPKVLTCRQHVLEMRHKFLHRLGRAQYNPKLPGYVSLVDLVRTNDEEFCKTIAMTSTTNYYNFQKMI